VLCKICPVATLVWFGELRHRSTQASGQLLRFGWGAKNIFRREGFLLLPLACFLGATKFGSHYPRMSHSRGYGMVQLYLFFSLLLCCSFKLVCARCLSLGARGSNRLPVADRWAAGISAAVQERAGALEEIGRCFYTGRRLP